MNSAVSGNCWQTTMLTLLKEAEVRHVAYVPDAGHANTIEMAHADPPFDLSF